uniref:Uncharacterized protein n=1 Tax=Rhizophora mucronata TaxID=61149 RepID=A0A2P2N0Y1_RHIMU
MTTGLYFGKLFYLNYVKQETRKRELH